MLSDCTLAACNTDVHTCDDHTQATWHFKRNVEKCRKMSFTKKTYQLWLYDFKSVSA